jgi:AhpD family alkylhydroperoxidase
MERQRLNLYRTNPDSMRALERMDDQIARSGLEKALITLVRLRTSQINGSGYCIDLLSRDARKAGETEGRLSMLVSWRGTACSDSFFSDRERAALEWTEAVTLIAQTHVPDEIWNRVKPHFTPEELVDLTLLVSIANTWNRFAISFRATPV